MKTEEEIRKKRDFIKICLEEEPEEITLGLKGKERLILKKQVLDWVLNEETVLGLNLMKRRIPSVAFTKKDDVLKFFEEDKSGRFFSVREVAAHLNLSKVSAYKYIRELFREKYLIYRINVDGKGQPKFYKFKK